MKTKYFCSISSKRSKDNIAGTASVFDHLLLIEYRAPFKNKAFDESEIPSNIKTTIQNYIKSKPNTKLLLIKKDMLYSRQKLSLYGASTKNNVAYNHIEIDSYNAISLKLLQNLFVEQKNIFTEINPLFLICTNGKKDKCCAKFGLPIWKEFGKINSNVWQCSHLGGDRFAPTALVLPSFATYGHISTEDVPLIVSYELEEKIYFKKLRGFASNNFYEQAAEIHIRKTQNIVNRNAVHIISNEKLGDNIFKICLKTNKSDMALQLIVEKRANKHFDYMTCNATKKSSSFEYIIV